MTRRETYFGSEGDVSRLSNAQFGHILGTFADITIVIDPAGVIEAIAVSPENRSLGCLDHWRTRNIRAFLTEDSQAKFEARLAGFDRLDLKAVATVEINHVDNASWEFPIRYMIHHTGIDGRLILTGRDMRPIAEVQQQLVRTQLALERDYEKFREFDTRYRVVMDATRDAIVIVNARTGRIADMNANAAQILGAAGDALVGINVAALFDYGKRGDLLESLTGASAASSRQLIAVQTARTGKRVTLQPRLFRAAGEMLMLCRIESQDGATPFTENLAHALGRLYDATADGIVLTDLHGLVRHANEAFLALSDLASPTEMEGRSLGEFLSRGGVDLKVLLENAGRTGRMRSYATRLKPAYGSEFPVEISATRIGGDDGTRFGFIIRTVAGRESLREGAAPVTEEEVRNAMDLVGTAPLREIVAATTDVVERICIETAVELTNNNRVAAAEMLGLSRQSLYVKLRKYGLIDRDVESGD